MNLDPILSTSAPDIGAILRRSFPLTSGGGERGAGPEGQLAPSFGESLSEIYLAYSKPEASAALVEKFERQVRQAPRDPDAHFKLMVVLSQLRQWEKVIAGSQV